MTRYAVSVFAYRQERVGNTINQYNRHCCFMVEEVSQLAAEGLAMRIARKGYPPEKGFKDHDVVVIPADQLPATVENCNFVPVP